MNPRLAVSLALLLGCAHGEPRPKLDYCQCLTWGMTGVDPGPDYQPPPRPPSCEQTLKQPRRNCSAPP